MKYIRMFDMKSFMDSSISEANETEYYVFDYEGNKKECIYVAPKISL